MMDSIYVAVYDDYLDVIRVGEFAGNSVIASYGVHSTGNTREEAITTLQAKLLETSEQLYATAKRYRNAAERGDYYG